MRVEPTGGMLGARGLAFRTATSGDVGTVVVMVVKETSTRTYCCRQLEPKQVYPLDDDKATAASNTLHALKPEKVLHA